MSLSPPEILRDGDVPRDRIIARAANVLGSGGLVIVPTDTVYGVAAAPGHEGRLFEAKGREAGKPIPILAADVAAVSRVAVLNGTAWRLARAFWPGPLTLVLVAGSTWEGYRVPDHDLACAVIGAVGGLLRVTSANRSGEPEACTAGAAVAALGNRVELVIDAGPSAGGSPSTVLRVGDDEIEVLRDGAIGEKTWRNAL